MIGGIYSNQKCSICGSNFIDDGKKGLVCSHHPNERASRFFVKIRGIWKRFKNYEEAQRFLTGIRYKIDEGSLDVRDYKKDNPLGFVNLITKWLEYKKHTVKRKSHNNLKNYANRAIDFFGDRNIKEIGYGEIEDFIYAQKVSDKTKSNMKSGLHDFWNWLRKRKVITLQQVPEFPETPFELGYRNTISKEDQEKILNEVYRISYHINQKIYLGIKWLSIYISMRPAELMGVKEGEIDLSNGYFIIPHPKEKRPKLIPLLEEDIEVIKGLPRGLPGLHFFRHTKGIKGAYEGQPFGEKYFYKWWKKACFNLGIESVDLYGGTRHSTARALRQCCTPEEIKRATMHSTNKAFERYYRIESDELRSVYRKATAPLLHHNQVQPKEAKVLNFKE